MPKKKLTPEQQEEAFNNWKNSEEFGIIENFMTERKNIKPFDNSNKDICDYWEKFLEALFKMVQKLKVPGRKAKSYEQQYIRTMFLEKCEKITIDGKTYEISNPTQVEIWNCKGKLCEIFQRFDDGTMEMQCNPETYISWKKDLVKELKEFDGMYVKHIK